MKLEESKLTGKHNRYNTMAASLAAKIQDVRKDVIREGLQSFHNVEHRLEIVGKVRNVDFINDSKATNVNAVWYALESIKQPIVWIAGGVDKGNDYDSLKPLVRERVRALICLGTDNSKLHAAFSDDIRAIVDTTSMEEAVKAAFQFAAPGSVVLLSPACASFDLFRNYEDRGRQFKEAITHLK